MGRAAQAHQARLPSSMAVGGLAYRPFLALQARATGAAERRAKQPNARRECPTKTLESRSRTH
eukprot:8584008-Alexandrium_andersonii.AAC.1